MQCKRDRKNIAGLSCILGKSGNLKIDLKDRLKSKEYKQDFLNKKTNEAKT